MANSILNVKVKKIDKFNFYNRWLVIIGQDPDVSSCCLAVTLFWKIQCRKNHGLKAGGLTRVKYRYRKKLTRVWCDDNF